MMMKMVWLKTTLILLPLQQQEANLLLYVYNKTTVDPVVNGLVPYVSPTDCDEDVATVASCDKVLLWTISNNS